MVTKRKELVQCLREGCQTRMRNTKYKYCSRCRRQQDRIEWLRSKHRGGDRVDVLPKDRSTW